jgi:hypothetical protein
MVSVRIAAGQPDGDFRPITSDHRKLSIGIDRLTLRWWRRVQADDDR